MRWPLLSCSFSSASISFCLRPFFEALLLLPVPADFLAFGCFLGTVLGSGPGPGAGVGPVDLSAAEAALSVKVCLLVSGLKKQSSFFQR